METAKKRSFHAKMHWPRHHCHAIASVPATCFRTNLQRFRASPLCKNPKRVSVTGIHRQRRRQQGSGLIQRSLPQPRQPGEMQSGEIAGIGGQNPRIAMKRILEPSGALVG